MLSLSLIISGISLILLLIVLNIEIYIIENSKIDFLREWILLGLAVGIVPLINVFWLGIFVVIGLIKLIQIIHFRKKNDI